MRGQQRGFTIIEVIIAVVVISAVLAGAIYFIAGAGKAQGRSAERQKLAAFADDISQRLRADRDWTKACGGGGAKWGLGTAGRECNLSTWAKTNIVPQLDGAGNGLQATVLVREVDGAGDGRGTADADGRLVDFFELNISVVDPASGDEQAQTMTTRSTMDAAELGGGTGSLVVEVCAVTNQSDERMNISGCGTSGTRLRMDPQVENPGGGCQATSKLSETQMANGQFRPVLPLGCNNAYNAAKAHKSDRVAVDVQPVTNATFTIRPAGTGWGVMGLIAPTARTQAEATRIGNTYVFKDLPAGRWEIDVAKSAGRTLWESQSIPAGGELSVQANQEARSLIMLRPSDQGKYNVLFSRQTYEYHLKHFTTTTTQSSAYGSGGVSIVYTWHWLQQDGKPTLRQRGGPAWSGLLTMEPKPFDRYRIPDPTEKQPAGFLAQLVAPIGYSRTAWGTGKWGMFQFGRLPSSPLPSGLHSSPNQHQDGGPSPAPPNAKMNYWGSFGARTVTCKKGGCDPKRRYVWISPTGVPDSQVSFFSTEGECYLLGPRYGTKKRPNNLLGGLSQGDRCDPTLYHKDMTVPNFFKTWQGGYGKRALWYKTATMTCSGTISCSGGSMSNGGSGIGGAAQGSISLNTVTVIDTKPFCGVSCGPPGTTPPPKTTTMTPNSSAPIVNPG